MNRIIGVLHRIYQGWDSFWFKPVDTISMACLRFCLCFTLLVFYLIRFFEVRIFFYESGLINAASAKAMHYYVSKNAFHLILSSDFWIYICYIVFIIVLFLMVMGVGNRLVSLLAFVLHLMFIQRNPTIVYGADYVATCWLFYLVFSQSHKQLKWVNFFVHKRKGLITEGASKGDWINTVSFRLVQIQLCFIYAFSGFSKLAGTSWQNGTAVWDSLLVYDSSFLFDHTLFLSMPVLVGTLSVAVILFEVYFPILIWFSRWRTIALVAGIMFHLGIGVFMTLWFFSLIMISSYVVFVPPEVLKRFFRRFQK